MQVAGAVSLVQVVIGIEEIQTKAIEVLVERLVEEEDVSTGSTAHLIISQLKWLGNTLEPDVVADKILEILEVRPAVFSLQEVLDSFLTQATNGNLQHSLIRLLPDLLADHEH